MMLIQGVLGTTTNNEVTGNCRVQKGLVLCAPLFIMILDSIAMMIVFSLYIALYHQ
jgi:hypothetical protein